MTLFKGGILTLATVGQEAVYANHLHVQGHINKRDHQPPHFHATYGGDSVIVSIRDTEVLEGGMPSKQLKMLLGRAALHQDELLENWALAEHNQELFPIDPLR